MRYHLTAAVVGTVLSLAALPGVALAQDLELALTNSSSQTLIVFQASPSGADSWGDIVLADGALAAGNQTPVIVSDGKDVCVYDMRFIMADETAREHNGVDLCASSAYTLQDE